MEDTASAFDYDTRESVFSFQRGLLDLPDNESACIKLSVLYQIPFSSISIKSKLLGVGSDCSIKFSK
jgi:hypothetical protein